jgi:predicted metal-dependent enzyme (double-stranded beta helix superfamily)
VSSLSSTSAQPHRDPRPKGRRVDARGSESHLRSRGHGPHRLRTLINGIDGVVHDPCPLDGRLEAIASLLAAAVTEPGLLPEQYRASSPDGYRANVVHIAGDGSFSVVALVWLPGQRTPIHSHRCWCVVAVHEGVQLETLYELDDTALKSLDHRVYRVGDVSWLSTEDEIHEVANIGDTRAISLHVYGTDYRRVSSSMLDTYPRLTEHSDGRWTTGRLSALRARRGSS